MCSYVNEARSEGKHNWMKFLIAACGLSCTGVNVFNSVCTDEGGDLVHTTKNNDNDDNERRD